MEAVSQGMDKESITIDILRRTKAMIRIDINPKQLYEENPSEWANKTITDFLGQIASWVDDYSMFDEETDWEKVDYKTIAKLLYMGKIYE